MARPTTSKMVELVCLNCGKTFYVKDYEARRRSGTKYCSRSCFYTSQRTSVVKKCQECGKEFVVTKSSSENRKNHYCSRKCFGASERGENHVFWKGGVSSDGYGQYRRGAIDRGLSFNLTHEEFKVLRAKPCFYCGSTEKVGIDRVDNSKGYSEDNVVPCCTVCNIMKRTFGVEVFLNHLRSIIDLAKRRALSNNQIGDNVTIWDYPNIYNDSIIGNNVKIGAFCEISGATIEDNVSIGAYCFIPKNVIIKSSAWLGPRTTFVHNAFPPAKPEDWAVTVVEENAKIGGAVTVLGGVTLGKGAIIGAGSLVLTDVPEGETWAGVPARKIKGREE